MGSEVPERGGYRSGDTAAGTLMTTWTAPPPASYITVLTAHGEKRFAAVAYEVDDNGYLVVRDPDREVARFAPSEWTGVHHPPVTAPEVA